MKSPESVEQRLRDALEAMGSTRAQSLSAGDLMEVVVIADGFQNDARRVAACLKACASLPTEVLEAANVVQVAAINAKKMADAARNELLSLALDRLVGIQDRGPEGHGWRSDELEALIHRIEKVLAR